MGCTNVLDVVKHPILNDSNPDATQNASNYLDEKQGVGRNFHVMAKLHSSSKVTGLRSYSVYNCLEHGIGNGPSWKHVTSNKLIHHWCRGWLITDGLKHHNWDGKGRCYQDTNNGSPDREVSGKNFDGGANKGEGNDTSNDIPPHGNLWVVLHKGKMNIMFIL